MPINIIMAVSQSKIVSMKSLKLYFKLFNDSSSFHNSQLFLVLPVQKDFMIKCIV